MTQNVTQLASHRRAPDGRLPIWRRCPRDFNNGESVKKMKYYSAVGKKGGLPFVKTWMSLGGIRLRETSQAEKDQDCMEPLKCGTSRKNNKRHS